MQSLTSWNHKIGNCLLHLNSGMLRKTRGILYRIQGSIQYCRDRSENHTSVGISETNRYFIYHSNDRIQVQDLSCSLSIYHCWRAPRTLSRFHDMAHIRVCSDKMRGFESNIVRKQSLRTKSCQLNYYKHNSLAGLKGKSSQLA